jgi:RND family efflux transporter MFP subunit
MRSKIPTPSSAAAAWLALLLSASVVSCSPAHADTGARSPIPVRTESVAAPPGQCVHALTGTLRADRRVDLAFKVGGYVTKLGGANGHPLEAGDKVRRGEVVAELRSSDYAAKTGELLGVRAQTSALRAQAEIDEARARRLLAADAIARAEYDGTKNRLDAAIAAEHAANAGVVEADILLADTRLVVPFDATVLARHLEPGALVAPGTVGYALASLERLRVDVAVAEKDARALRIGDSIEIDADEPPAVRRARVLTVAPSVDPRTRLVPLELVVDNTDGALREGRPAQVRIPERCPPAVAVVPVTSVSRAAGDTGPTYVWVSSVARGRGRVERRTVAVTGLIGSTATVTGDVRVGERVVTAGATVVAAGAEIEVLP